MSEMDQYRVGVDGKKRFAFGANWKRYAKGVGPDEIDHAKASLTPWLPAGGVAERSFLDIGCGSGLFSLAARELGFGTVTSFDYDENSVQTTRSLQARFSPDSPGWTVRQGSVLDPAVMKAVGPHDFVYSWGVLHHTGDMWTAMENAFAAVKPGGRCFIALYNDQGWVSRYWKAVKWSYVSSPKPLKGLFLLFFWAWFGSTLAVADLVRLRNPLTRYRGDQRGMKFFTDVIDWVGGYPFEVATPEAVAAFARDRGFSLVWEKRVGWRHGCNEFVFERRTG